MTAQTIASYSCRSLPCARSIESWRPLAALASCGRIMDHPGVTLIMDHPGVNLILDHPGVTLMMGQTWLSVLANSRAIAEDRSAFLSCPG